jgi:hypothetical protein
MKTEDSVTQPATKNEVKPKKRVHNILQQPSASNRMARNSPTSTVLPSHQYFTRKKIIPANPENHVTKYSSLNHKDPTSRAEHERMQQTAGTSTFSNPKPAMLEIMSKMRQKASTPAAYRGEMHTTRSLIEPTSSWNIGCRPQVKEETPPDEDPQEEPQFGGSWTTAAREIIHEE